MIRKTSFRIDSYIVECVIELGRRAPHVGANSPRFLDPGTPAKMVGMRVFKDQIDVTDERDPAELARLKAQACRLAGVYRDTRVSGY
jgi:hypothetical protein